MKNKDILLVSDFVGVGRVALSCMIPVLSTMEGSLSYLPTAVVSNNFGYGEAVIKDLTDFMVDSKEMWKKKDFKFDIVSTGIIMNTKQVDIVREIIDWHEERPLVISDPIMGDGGKVYPGLPEDMIEASRQAVLLADIILPNITELALIVGEEYRDDLDHETLVAWLEKLMNQGVKAAAITGVKIGSSHFVYGYNMEKEIFRVEYRHLPIEIGGAGDVFSSLLIGLIQKDLDLKEGVKKATDILSNIIEAEYNRGIGDWAMEIEIERYLKDIREVLL